MNTQQPAALHYAEVLEDFYLGLGRMDATGAAAELRRLHLHELALAQWLEKTEWVQVYAQPIERGWHRADVVQMRVARLHALNQELLGALRQLMDMTGEPPDANCSCHISPPCNDCVENTGWRDAFTFAQSTIAKADTAQKDFPEAVADATI